MQCYFLKHDSLQYNAQLNRLALERSGKVGPSSSCCYMFSSFPIPGENNYLELLSIEYSIFLSSSLVVALRYDRVIPQKQCFQNQDRQHYSASDTNHQ